MCRYDATLEGLQLQDNKGWQCSLAGGRVIQAKRIVGDLFPGTYLQAVAD